MDQYAPCKNVQGHERMPSDLPTLWVSKHHAALCNAIHENALVYQ